jgi:hypothetical protein
MNKSRINLRPISSNISSFRAHVVPVVTRKHTGIIEKFTKSKLHQKGDFALSRDCSPRFPQKKMRGMLCDAHPMQRFGRALGQTSTTVSGLTRPSPHVRSQPLLCLELLHLGSFRPISVTSSVAVSIYLWRTLWSDFRGAPSTRIHRLETHAACSRQCAMFRSNRQTFWCLRWPFARLCHLANRQTKISCLPYSTRFE